MAYKTQTFDWTYTGTILSYGLGDFNGDGVIDFIFGGPTTPFKDEAQPFGMISINASGAISVSSAIFASASYAIHAREMFVGDLNGDGIADFFSANHGYDAEPWPGERNTLLLSSGGRLVDASATNIPQNDAFSHSVTGGDIDRDGDIDLFVGVLGDCYFLINDGTGKFTRQDAIVPDRVGTGWDATGRFTSCLLADINNDGALDLIVGSEQNGLTAGVTYLNDGTGNFLSSTESFLPVGLYGAGQEGGTIVHEVMAEDINGDGFLDLILTESDGDPFYQGQTIQILINDKTGHFSDETAVRITQDHKGSWVQNLKFIDVNGDGHKDILAQTDNGDPDFQTVLWLNNGSGAFVPASKEMFADFEGGIIPVDLDGDGRMDFLSFRKEGTFYSGGNKWEFKTHLWQPDPPPNPHERILCGNGADDIHGNDGNDTIYGNRGNDWLYGDSGDDWLYGGYDNDRLDGGSGADRLYGDTGNDRLYGGAGNDILSGGSGRDTLSGDVGNDTISGGLESDVLYGGAGNDVFVLDTKPLAIYADAIKDFDPVYDTIRLENAYFKVGNWSASKPLKMSSKMFWTGTKAHDRDDRIIYNKTSGALYYDADGTGKAAQVKIATLSKNLKMSYHDFFVV